MRESRNGGIGREGLSACVLMRGVSRAALAISIAIFSGCTEKVSQTTQYTNDQMAPVVSGAPQRDGSAAAETDRALSQVRWQVIQKKGPRTAGEQFDIFTKDPKVAAAEARKERIKRESRDEAMVNGSMKVSVPMPPNMAAGPSPTTQPTTQPVMQTFEVPLVSEEGLPVEVIGLPDGKVRLVWRLRSYGGSVVASTRDPATSRRNVVVTPGDLVPLVTVLQQQLGTAGTVTPLPRENTLVVTCDRIMKSSMLDMLSKLDLPPKQVEISAKIFEVSRDFDFQSGARVLAKHVGTDNTQQGLSTFDTQRMLDSTAAASPFQGSVISLMKVFQDAGLSIDASFQLLADAGLIRVVSSPRMTVAAGQTGYMLAGQELPIQSANLVNNILQTTTQYKPVGVQLYITPQAVGPKRVKLHTISIVSSVSGFAPVPLLQGGTAPTGLINPVIESREAETAVTVDDGSTLVISGLRMVRTTTRENKVPGLGDLPLLGWMFKNHRSQQQMTDLYFFVTPTLLDDSATASAG